MRARRRDQVDVAQGTCPQRQAEGFFGTPQQEFFYGREWAGVSPGAFEAELLAYVGWQCARQAQAVPEGGRSFTSLPTTGGGWACPSPPPEVG